MRKLRLYILASLSIVLLIQPLQAALQSGVNPDFDGSGVVDFFDFLQFAGKFGSSQGDEEYEDRFDLDGDGEIGFDDFFQFVGHFGKAVPVSVGTLDPVMVSVGGDTVVVDVSGAFSDADSDTLTYTAASSDTAIATVNVMDAVVRITPVGEGDATITVTASDPGGLTGTQTIAVRVDAAFKSLGLTAREVVDRETLKAFVDGLKLLIPIIEEKGPNYLATVQDAIRTEGGDFKYGSIYLIVLRNDGLVIFHGADPSHENQNMIDLEDVNGVKIVQEILAAAAAGGGFVEYYWDNPAVQGDEDIHSPKLTYAIPVTLFGIDGAVAAGIYLGSGSTVQVGEDEAVQIRSLLSHTIAPSLGAPLHYSVELAVRDFARVHGYEIELGEPIDGMCTPEGGRAGAEQIIADPQVLGVIGTSCSAAAVEASPLLSAAGLVMISPSNTSPLLTSDLAGNANSNYHPGYFRTSNNDLYQAKAVADFAYNKLDLRRMVAVHDGDPYTTALVSAFDNEFRALGGEVAVIAAIEKGDTDMTAVLVKFAEAGPDGIFFPLFRTEGSPFARQVRAFDGLEGVTLITGAAMLVSEFLGTPQSEAIYFAGPESDHGSNVNVATGKNAEAVLAAFEATYGGSPGTPYWAHAYDATTLLLSAIDSVAVEDGGKLYINRAALRTQIRATADFQGITGVLSCDDFGDFGTGRINIYHHTDPDVTDTAQLPVVYRFAP